MKALKVLNFRLKDLQYVFNMYRSTQCHKDILDTEEAILELESFIDRRCDECEFYNSTFPSGIDRDEPLCSCQDSNCCGSFVNSDFNCKYHKLKEIK